MSVWTGEARITVVVPIYVSDPELTSEEEVHEAGIMNFIDLSDINSSNVDGISVDWLEESYRDPRAEYKMWERK